MSPSYPSACAIARLLAVVVLASSILPVASARSVGPDPGTVRGVAWNSDNSPIPSAKVRLRNLDNGRITSNGQTTNDGQFSFGSVPPGTYAVELVNENGKVLAVSQSFSVEPGQTVSTVVQLTSRKPWFVGMFSNTAAVAIAAASSVGLLAIGSHGPPVSPQ
jgi:Carboxypeptidase regulatory-like domain